MKFTLSWLKEYLETEATLAQITETLTQIGLEVESVSNHAESLKDFIVAEIIEAAPHPNASKLQVCQVNDGSITRQIVCGAPNARAGLKTVLAREGVFIPGSGITIKKTKIRDVESNGMLCSAEELALDTKSEGILELPSPSVSGSPAADALGLNDPMIEIAITPNRGDCLGVYGIARDLAAAGLGTLKPMPVAAFTPSFPSPITVTRETEACPLFIGCHIRGVKNGPSPEWLQKRLTSIGLKPISTLVDITNYFTFAYGRPLHVFDAAKIQGGITIRLSRGGERLGALNDKEYALPEGAVVIADDTGALAAGGIIGGKASGCSAETTDVFLEVALFDPIAIALAGRAMEVNTDARYRFERGLDPAFAETAAKMAVVLIVELCGGTASELVISGSASGWQREIPFHYSRVESLGGVTLSEQQSQQTLSSLGCEIWQEGNIIHVSPPSWRRDIEGEADLVEEILRIYGYHHLPATPLPKPASVSQPALNAHQKRERLARRALAARGLMEAITWSFLPRAQAVAFGGVNAALELLNPISADLDYMRPSLIPNLLTAARNNHFRGANDVALFEVGAQFTDITPTGQQNVAAGVRSGTDVMQTYPDNRFERNSHPKDAFDAKADMFAVLKELGFNPGSLSISRNAPSWYHPGRSGACMLGKTVIGYFGEIHPSTQQAFDLKERVVGFELFLAAIPQSKNKGKAKTPLQVSDFPAVERDFAFVVKQDVPAADILRILQAADKQLIKSVELFDVYAGKGLEADEKSVAVRVSLQASDRTLTEAEITNISQMVITAAAKHFGGMLRG